MPCSVTRSGAGAGAAIPDGAEASRSRSAVIWSPDQGVLAVNATDVLYVFAAWWTHTWTVRFFHPGREGGHDPGDRGDRARKVVAKAAR